MGSDLTRANSASDRNLVFISYSHADARWLKPLRVHLKPLERLGAIELWDDTRIKAGTAWRQEIRRALERARVAVLLVSADFLASDFIASNELQPLLEAAEERGTLILPLIIRHCRFEQTEGLARFQAVNNPSRPLADLPANRRDAVFVALSSRIEEALRTTSSGRGSAGQDAPAARGQPPRGTSNRKSRPQNGSKPIREVQFGSYTVRRLESGSIEVERDGQPLTPAKPALRELARKLKVDLVNGRGNPLNTQQLGALVIRRIEQLGTTGGEEGARHRDAPDIAALWRTFEASHPPHEIALAREIERWLVAAGAEVFPLNSGTGFGYMIVTAAGRKYYLCKVTLTGKVQVWFQYLASYEPFTEESVRHELRERLNRIPGVSLPAERVNGKPAFPLAALQSPEDLDIFKEAWAWAIEQIRKSGTPDDPIA